MSELLFFSGFIIFIVAILFIDLKVIGKDAHEVSLKESLIWSVIWVGLAVAFFFVIWFMGEQIHGIQNWDDLLAAQKHYAPHLELIDNNFTESVLLYRHNMAIEYITGYLVEKSLSVDNIFVIMMILTSFSVKKQNYKQVLAWGILGAIVLRCFFIFAGSALIQHFEWILYVFGVFLVYTGVKIYIERNKEEKIEPQKHWLVKILSKYFPVFPRYVDNRFFIRNNVGKLLMTPLFIVLLIVEFTDLIFAFDSIPAIFGISRDPYVVFFSNIFAILGLRALFFLLIRILDKFHYIKIGVAVLLVFVGFKLIAEEWLHEIGFKTIYSLLFILATLTVSILLSLLFPKKDHIEFIEHPAPPTDTPFENLDNKD